MKKNYNQARQHSFQIPKITSLQPLFTTYNENHTEPTTPIKIDLKAKQEQMKLELEQKNKYLEQILCLKQERYHHNRKELLYHKLQNIEQQLHKWNQTRKNIELQTDFPILAQKRQNNNICVNITIHNNPLSLSKLDKLNTRIPVFKISNKPKPTSEILNLNLESNPSSTSNIKRKLTKVHVMQRKLKLGNLDSQIIPNDDATLTYISQIFIFKQNCKSFLPNTMMQAHLHVFSTINKHHQVGQSQPHTSEAPVLQFLGKSKKRKRRSLDTNDWISLHDHKIKGNSHTQYLIRLKVDNVVWSFWTRYSMLSELHQTLDEVIKSQLPTFPEKRLFGNLNPNFIQTRKSQLDIYLQAIFNDPCVRDSKVFRDFIDNSKQKAFKKADLDSLNRFKLDV
ncbi:unnamed protein product (macronuclear) [Paramecium tetraurelia]|uniref:PX domain-containing protein n=1 Tax=Paramecium tetraurelia TaxID=5888 RepID=A0BY41_PARTE|nr:uncharacterized protein GSPATT00033311001 [Paramecium tetraurelia]CAK63458.1 unnamed protein product [Paramecium tetraurelia]|eukprot:XP_001430856.1 hypothetical protein (macronuclear) [Paramecium tetraurelia strain d4-2]